jgi:hypothetical protein
MQSQFYAVGSTERETDVTGRFARAAERSESYAYTYLRTYLLHGAGYSLKSW